MQKKISAFAFITMSFLLLMGCQPKANPCQLTSSTVHHEIEQVKELLLAQSPYMNINNKRVVKTMDSIVNALDKKKVVDSYKFESSVKHMLKELGDRHARANYIGDCGSVIKYYLPFALAPFKDSLVVVLAKQPKITFSPYLENFPYLTHINRQNIKAFIAQYDAANDYAPKLSKLALGVEKLNEFYKMKSDLSVGDELNVTLRSRDFKSDTTVVIKLTDSKSKWRDVDSYLFFNEKDDNLNQLLFRQYEDQIAYIKIPEMYNYSENTAYFNWLKQKMDSVKNTNALIIDIRNNGGGNRDLIDFFSNYFLGPEDFKIANLARYRGDVSDATKKSLNSRRLYPYADFKEPQAQQAIDEFMATFEPTVDLSNDLYSEYYYMVLNADEDANAFTYDKPIYILTNEMTFSAASVFASSFKDLKNITIAGVNTDGSSGLSKSYELKNSDIQFSFSHMLSYQKNGNIFDGIGTAPDIEISRSIEQIMGQEDYQLKTLLNIINNVFSTEK
ncbi:S41 family peptidase [Psychroserpens sp. BH13MA-6]